MAKQNIVNYIKTNIEKGYSLEQLKQALIQNGYSSADIEEALKAINPSSPPSPQPSPRTEKSKGTKTLVILYVLFLFLELFAMLGLFLVGQAVEISLLEQLPLYGSVIVTIIIIIGIYLRKKWGLYLAFALSIYSIASNILSFNIIAIGIQAVILYYLYIWRHRFS